MGTNAISLTIKLPPQAHQRLHAMAKPRGYTASAYAQLLFDAAFAARVGQERETPASDAELDRQVSLVFACAGQGDTNAISRATGVAPARVEAILAAWRRSANRKG
jgi:hypothetical protein